MTARASWRSNCSASGLVYGSVSSGQLLAFDVNERQVVERWEMRWGRRLWVYPKPMVWRRVEQ